MRALVPPTPDFPDIDPEDPMTQKTPTPIWDEIRDRWLFSRAQGFIDTATGRVCKKEQFADGEAYRAPALRIELNVPKKQRPSGADMFLRQ